MTKNGKIDQLKGKYIVVSYFEQILAKIKPNLRDRTQKWIMKWPDQAIARLPILKWPTASKMIGWPLWTVTVSYFK